MTARFVQIKPSLLKRLLKDPDSVEELFAGESANVTAAAMERLRSMQKLLLNRAPALLGGGMPGLDPRLRQDLVERLGRLGLTQESIKSGNAEDALASVMSRIGPHLSPVASSRPSSGKGAEISLDKGWHGVHYLLCGQAEPGTTILSRAVMGGTEIGEDFSGYGEARYFTIQQVAEIARELTRVGLEDEIKQRSDPARMSSLEVYPGGWDVTGTDWLLPEFHKLRDFYSDASARGFAVLTCIV